MKPTIDIILLAAGASRRMKGGDKTLERVGGLPLLRHLAMECTRSQARSTIVVLPPDRPERHSTVDDLKVTSVTAADAGLGMSASLKAGLAAATGADAILIMLADMPEITAAHLDAIICEYRENLDRSIIRATASDGTPGHPVLFDKRHFAALADLTGDTGAKHLMRSYPAHKVALEGTVAITDLDTPEDWEAWRSG